MYAITIATISYNQSKFIERAIESVLNNGFKELQYIIVDAGSTDGSREIITGFSAVDNRIRYIFEDDNGPASGLNKAVAIADGPLFGYLNSDDEYMPGAIERAVKIFRSNVDLDVIYGHGGVIDQHGELSRRIRSHRFDISAFRNGCGAVVQQASFFKTSAIRKVGGFNESNRTCWDGELLCDLAVNEAKMTRVNGYFGLFRVYPESITGSQRLAVAYRADRDRICKRLVGDPKRPSKLDFLRAYSRQILLDPLRVLVRCADRFIRPGALPWLDGWSSERVRR